MAAPSKTQGVVIAAMQALATASQYVSPPYDMRTKFGGLLTVRVGRQQTNALTVGTKVRVETGGAAAADGNWTTLMTFQTAIATALTFTVTNNPCAIGTTVLTANPTNVAVGDYLLLYQGTQANSEFARVKAVSANVSVTVEEGISKAQVGAVAFSKAEGFVCQIPPEAAWVRVILDTLGNAANAAIVFMALLDTIDTVA
jgi:hypothetical protein